jgi:hypothetical protein
MNRSDLVVDGYYRDREYLMMIMVIIISLCNSHRYLADRVMPCGRGRFEDNNRKKERIGSCENR